MNLNIFQLKSLKTRVTLFTLVIFMVSIWSLAFYASRTLREDLERLLGAQQFSTATLMADSINHELNKSAGGAGNRGGPCFTGTAAKAS